MAAPVHLAKIKDVKIAFPPASYADVLSENIVESMAPSLYKGSLAVVDG